MAAQRLSYGSFDGYFFSIYYDTDKFSPGFSPAPGFQGYEERVANWSMRYEGQDAYKPGIVPSRFDLTLVMSDGYLRSMLQSSTGGVWLKVWRNMSLEWAGFCTPDLGEIEVINGQRFITLPFSDGFGILDFQANEYVFVNPKPFSMQIAEMFTRLEFTYLWDGMLVSNTVKASNSGSGKDGVYWTGTIQEGHYYEPGETTWHNYRKVIDDILVALGLRMYQEKGYLVLRDVATDTPSQWTAYDWQGNYVHTFTYSSTASSNVIAGGTEMYLPSVRDTEITFTTAETLIKLIATKAPRLNYYIGHVIPTGTNHLDGYASMVAYFRVDPSTPRTDVFFDIFAVIRVGAYYYNGTSWTTTLSQFQIINNHKDSIENLGGSEAIVAGLPFAITNFHTSDLPDAGLAPCYITYTIVETGGPYAGIQTERIDSSIEYYYHGDQTNTTVYKVDNGYQRFGVDKSYTVNIGDLVSASPIAKQLRAFYLEPRGVATLQPSNWEGDSLLHRTAYRLAQKQSIPQQYYELDLDERVTLGHTATWGGQNYTPINIEVGTDGTRVTYVEQLTEDPQRDSKFQPV
jgi:hypothetical protein